MSNPTETVPQVQAAGVKIPAYDTGAAPPAVPIPLKTSTVTDPIAPVVAPLKQAPPADPAGDARQAITKALDEFAKKPSHIKAGELAGLIVNAIITLNTPPVPLEPLVSAASPVSPTQ